jgi:predicted enzyme related to lactoylglutathione lyase
MGEYEDFVMEEPESGKPVAGVCHARGSNADLPPVWLVYFTVSDLDASLSECRRLDGSVLGEVRNMGTYGRMAIVRDPAGAVCAIIEPAK